MAPLTLLLVLLATTVVLTAARDAVAKSLTQPGIDPTIADRVLRRLDTRGSQPE